MFTVNPLNLPSGPGAAPGASTDSLAPTGNAVGGRPGPVAGAPDASADAPSDEPAVTGSTMLAIDASYDDDAELATGDDPVALLGHGPLR